MCAVCHGRVELFEEQRGNWISCILRLSDLVKKRINLRNVGLPSNRPKPLNCPDWAAVPIAELPDATVDTLNDSILDDSF